MAVGDITHRTTTRAIQLLAAATATNGVPSGADAGVALQDVWPGPAFPSGMIHIASTAGSGTMTATFKWWGYWYCSAVWAPVGAHATAASRGLLNLASAVDETQADLLRHAEVVSIPWGMDRTYLEITAIGGTATAVSAWLVLPQTA